MRISAILCADFFSLCSSPGARVADTIKNGIIVSRSSPCYLISTDLELHSRVPFSKEMPESNCWPSPSPVITTSFPVILHDADVRPAVMVSSLWLTTATRMGWPVSTTYSIVSAVAGVGVALGGSRSVNWGWNNGKGYVRQQCALRVPQLMRFRSQTRYYFRRFHHRSGNLGRFRRCYLPRCQVHRSRAKEPDQVGTRNLARYLLPRRCRLDSLDRYVHRLPSSRRTD